MHRSRDINGEPPISPVYEVEWPADSITVDEWLATQPHNKWKHDFEKYGFLKIDNVLTEPEIIIYRDVYSQILSGKIDASLHRHDLGSHDAAKVKDTENICQVMWPTLYVKGLMEGPAHERCLAVSRVILGEDMAHDFDFLISKAPHTDTITPWHCDESYWPDMSDKRAVSFWIAMDQTMVENGCMWFSSGSHKRPIRSHHPAAPGSHVLTCDGDESEGEPVPLKPGQATCHSGRTMHYSRGNSTDKPRRGFVVSFRPEAMVKYEREHNFDHGYKGLKEVLNRHNESLTDRN